MRQWYSDAYTEGFNKGYEKGKKEAQKERKKGEWIKVDPNIVICPFCKHASPPKNFCADCGADMRSENK